MDQQVITLAILGMALVTWPPRFLPALLLANRSLNRPVQVWLSHVPTAIMAALVTPSVLAPAGVLEPVWSNLYFWAAAPTLAFALLTRSFFGTVAVGLVIVAAARAFGLA